MNCSHLCTEYIDGSHHYWCKDCGALGKSGIVWLSAQGVPPRVSHRMEDGTNETALARWLKFVRGRGFTASDELLTDLYSYARRA